MSSQPLSILLVGRIYQQDQVFLLINKVIIKLSQHLHINFYLLDERTLDKIKIKQNQYKTTNKITFNLFKNDITKSQKNIQTDKIDYVITIGGDGTILYTAKQFQKQAPPIIAFQRGTLGFMCRFQQEQIEQVIQQICQYQKNIRKDNQSNTKSQLSNLSNTNNQYIKFPFPSTQIMRIKATQSKTTQQGQILESFTKTCINEVCISRKQCQRIVLQIQINNQKITQTAGDGILISTPTGSTAYSLSAGGPIMQNGVNSILITPIAPNSLSFRPICLPSDSQITIKLSKKSRSTGYVSFDGQSNLDFSQGSQVTITKSEYGIKFLQPSQKMNKMPSWMQRLKYFLGWNQVFKYPQCKYRKNI